MSLVLGAIGGAGSALQDMGAAWMKSDMAFDNESRLAGVRSDLELGRQKALALYQDNLKNAPLQRLGSKAKEFGTQDVAQEPNAAQLTGYDPQAVEAGPSIPGFKGDPEKVAAAISSMAPGPDRDAAIAQFKRQLGSDQGFEASLVTGKTRKRTGDEAMRAAVEDAKANDLPAYAAYEREIGKPLRDERRVDVQDKRADNQAAASAASEERKERIEARRMMVDLAKLDLQQGSLDATNRKIDAWIENEAAKRDRDEEKLNNPKTSSPERLSTIVNAMNNTIRDLDNNKPSSSKADALKEWQQQRDNAIAVRARAMSKLNQNFDDGGVPSPSPAPAPKPATSAPRPPLSNFLK